MTSKLGVVFLGYWVLICSGCALDTLKHPLVDPAEAKPMPELYGVYRTTEFKEGFLNYVHVATAGGDYPPGFLRGVLVGQPRDPKTPVTVRGFVGFIEPLGRYHILHCPFPQEGVLEDQPKISSPPNWKRQDVTGYMAIRLEIGKESVEASGLNREFIVNQIRSGKLAGEVHMGEHPKTGEPRVSNVSITAKQKELRAFFEKHMDAGLFQETSQTYRRI